MKRGEATDLDGRRAAPSTIAAAAPSTIAAAAPSTIASDRFRLLAVGPLTPVLSRNGRWSITQDRARADALLVRSLGQPPWLLGFLHQRPLMPVIFVGSVRGAGEHRIPDHTSRALVPVLDRIEPVLAAIGELPPEVHRRVGADSHLALAAWLWSRGGRVSVEVSARYRNGYGYPCEVSVREPAAVLESLATAGYLDRELAEAAHACPRCESLHVLLRDTCAACASIDIREEALVHHFACAYQAAEPAFGVAGGTYVCPKCRRQLRHFGMDYDKPGTLSVCRACGHESSETTVRGRCMSCEERFDAQASVRRGLYDYRLNEHGVHALFQGVMRPSDLTHLLEERLALVTPEAFVSMARALAAVEARHALPTLVAEVDMEAVGEGADSLGTRIRLVTALGRELSALLRPTDVVAYSVGSLWLLLPGSGAAASPRIVERLGSALGEIFDAAVLGRLRYHTMPVSDWLARGAPPVGDAP